MTDINEIGKQCAELLKQAKEQNATALTKANDLLVRRQAKIKPMLEQVWKELEAKRPVNGIKSKGAFAKSVGYSRRALEYIVYGRPEKKERVRTGVRTFNAKLGDQIRFEGQLWEAYIPAQGRPTLRLVNKPAKHLANSNSKAARKRRANPEVHPSFMTMPAKPHKVHYCNNGYRLCHSRKPLADGDVNKGGDTRKVTCKVCADVLRRSSGSRLPDWARHEEPAKVTLERLEDNCPTDEQTTETTPNGYYAKLNRKPKGATQESQPWEIYLTIHGKAKFCARERSKQDAEARCWKLDRISQEERQRTPTAAHSEATGGTDVRRNRIRWWRFRRNKEFRGGQSRAAKARKTQAVC